MIENIIRVAFFILIPTICYYFAKKTDRWSYSWKDITWIIFFAYLWSFLNIFIHEYGHALTACCFGIAVNEISVGTGWKLFSLGGGEHTKMTFRIFPISGYTRIFWEKTRSQQVIISAMGIITQFLFLSLVYWLLKSNKKWRETIIGHFCYHYAVKIAFWLTFIFNFPFVSSGSDWTKITKILFGQK